VQTGGFVAGSPLALLVFALLAAGLGVIALRRRTQGAHIG